MDMLRFDERVELETLVIDRLRQFEQEKNAIVIAAVESGSRSWGFESKDSDYDVRFVYVHHGNWYLSLTHMHDADTTTFDGGKNGIIDFHGWELRKALSLCARSNPSFYEWMSSPICYIANPELAATCRDYLDLEALRYHYASMLKSTWSAHLNDRVLVVVKKYLYAIRPALCALYIAERSSPPPMNMMKLMGELTLDVSLKSALVSLVQEKKCGLEMGMGHRIRIVDNFLMEVMSQNRGGPAPTADLRPGTLLPLDRYLRIQVTRATKKLVKESKQHG